MSVLTEGLIAYAPLINTLATAVIAYVVYRAQKEAKERDVVAAAERVQFGETITKLEVNTNSIKDALVAKTEEAALAVGEAKGVASEVAKQAVKDAASTLIEEKRPSKDPESAMRVVIKNPEAIPVVMKP